MLCYKKIKVALLIIFLIGCDFQPLYGTRGNSIITGEMKFIEVSPISDRMGQTLRNHLIQNFKPLDNLKNSKYVLNIQLSENKQNLAIKKSEIATRANLIIIANYQIISKFIKDISFEIPNTQAFVMLEKEISNYSLNFDVKSKPYKDNIIEVNTTLKMVPNQNVKHKILGEITGASLVSIDKNFKDKTELEKIVLVTIPQEIYPTLYETFVFLFKQAGVKNIQINKEVNFQKLFDARKK